jgi:MarR family transcriptional regulator, protease production regulatory protein HPr
MKVSHEDHLLLNYLRGLGKVLEEEWQENAHTIGITSAEQHVMWIVHTKSKLSVSEIARIGLWDRSTVMQMIKRLSKKNLIHLSKDKKDLRLTYVSLTDEGKKKRDESERKDFKLFEFIKAYSKENERFIEDLIHFHREANLHFHGKDFVEWVESSSNESFLSLEKGEHT